MARITLGQCCQSKLFNVFPPDSTNDELDKPLTNRELPCKSTNRNAAFMTLPDVSYFIITQFHRLVVSLAHILHVLSVSSNIKMSRVTTRWIVAMVTAFHSFRYRTKSEFPSQPMSNASAWIDPKNSFPRSTLETPVSFWGNTRSPRPALGRISFLNFLPKSNFDRGSLCVHDGYGILPIKLQSSKDLCLV